MAYEEILYDVDDRVATVTLNRTQALNAWTARMAVEYRHALGTAEQDENVRAIIITGAGRGFCAGADMNMLGAITEGNAPSRDGGSDLPFLTPGSEQNPRPDFQQEYSWPLAIRKPIIAAINGAAAGLGFIHTLYCDIRFAADTAKFTTAFARRGLIAEHGIGWMLPRLIGTSNAMDLLFSGRIIMADEAQRMGLVSRVVPADELMPMTREYARELTTLASPRSQSIMKWQVYNGMFEDLATYTGVANEEMVKSFSTADFREGVESFVERRPPNFTGK